MIELRFSGGNIAELFDQMREALGHAPNRVPEAYELMQTERVLGSTEPQPEPDAPTKKTASYVLEDVRALLKRIQDTFGVTMARELLGHYNAPNLPALDPSNYDDLVIEATNMLIGEDK